MPIDVIMPRLGLTMESGTVERWLASAGERLESGQPLLEVETDKVVVEVEAPAPGILGTLLVAEGESAPIGALLARIYAPGEEAVERREGESPQALKPQPSQGTGQAPPVAPRTQPVAPEPAATPDVIRNGGLEGRVEVQEVQQAGQRERAFSSPRARKRAREADLDWRAIPGSGPRGRVIERDVLAAVVARQPSTIDERRQAILHRPSSPVSQFSLSAEARAHALLELHERLLPSIERRAGVHLTMADLLVKIVAVSLAEHPSGSAFWDREGSEHGRLPPRVDLGLAVATDAGVMVPVLRDVARQGLAGIAAGRMRLIEKARQGTLLPDDMGGGALALVDLSIYRVDTFQTIANPAQLGILAVGRLAERPVASEGQVCVRPTVVLTLSCDQRMLDGVQAARLLDRVVELIEEPYGLIA